MLRSKTMVCPASADVLVVETGCGVTLLEMLASRASGGVLQCEMDLLREGRAPF